MDASAAPSPYATQTSEISHDATLLWDTASVLNLAAFTMASLSFFMRHQYIQANQLFWEADVAFVRAELLAHFAFAISFALSAFDIFFHSHNPTDEFCVERLILLWVPLLVGATISKDQTIFPQNLLSIVPQRNTDDLAKLSFRLTNDLVVETSDLKGFWYDIYQRVKREDEESVKSGVGLWLSKKITS
nr:hypothetical protein L203_01077 [Cryptococcus depauperatus CBS 7841]